MLRYIRALFNKLRGVGSPSVYVISDRKYVFEWDYLINRRKERRHGRKN